MIFHDHYKNIINDPDYGKPDGEDWRDDEEEKLTKTELAELADYMIEQWKKFRSLQESNR